MLAVAAASEIRTKWERQSLLDATMVNPRSTADNFRVIQFHALRAEILGIKERVIKLQVIGITGIPLVIGGAEKYDISIVLIVSPLVTLAFAFMLLFEQGSLMRAGEYIKNNIEESLCPDGLTGWEKWLQEKPKRRRAEVFFACSAHIVFAVYYAIGSWLSFHLLKQELTDAIANLALGLYGGGFVLAITLIFTNFRIGTVPPVKKPING